MSVCALGGSAPRVAALVDRRARAWRPRGAELWWAREPVAGRSVTKSLTVAAAVAHVNERGALLVYPIKNAPSPPSLWHAFYPRSEMRWEWDDGIDERVAGLWHLRAKLSTSRRVVYTKWFRGRATLLSLPLFTAMIAALRAKGEPARGLSAPAARVLEELEGNSPLSTKVLREACEMRGREHESGYQRALGELFARLLVVGFGEVAEGSFPSLALGATGVLFENEWLAAMGRDPAEARAEVVTTLGAASPFLKAFARVEALVART